MNAWFFAWHLVSVRVCVFASLDMPSPLWVPVITSPCLPVQMDRESKCKDSSANLLVCVSVCDQLFNYYSYCWDTIRLHCHTFERFTMICGRHVAGQSSWNEVMETCLCVIKCVYVSVCVWVCVYEGRQGPSVTLNHKLPPEFHSVLILTDTAHIDTLMVSLLSFRALALVPQPWTVSSHTK